MSLVVLSGWIHAPNRLNSANDNCPRIAFARSYCFPVRLISKHLHSTLPLVNIDTARSRLVLRNTKHPPAHKKGSATATQKKKRVNQPQHILLESFVSPRISPLFFFFVRRPLNTLQLFLSFFLSFFFTSFIQFYSPFPTLTTIATSPTHIFLSLLLRLLLVLLVYLGSYHYHLDLIPVRICSFLILFA